MYYFTSDYTTGCTPEILEVLGATNLEETAGYGETHTAKLHAR